MKKIIFVGCMFVLLLAILVGCGSTSSTASFSSSSTYQSYRINYTITLISNNSVGNDWGTTVSCDGDPIRSGEIITGAVGSYITIRANVTEYDSIPDSASGSLRLRLIDGTSDSVTISVKENRGKYAGNTARWKLTCSIKEQ